jgi:hypothetical protein
MCFHFVFFFFAVMVVTVITMARKRPSPRRLRRECVVKLGKFSRINVCICVCARASTPTNYSERNIFFLKKIFPSFSSNFLLLLLTSAYSYEDDIIIIIVLGGKSGHVCLGDRSGRSEHIPTDLKGLLLLVVVVVALALFCLRVVIKVFFVSSSQLFLVQNGCFYVHVARF